MTRDEILTKWHFLLREAGAKEMSRDLDAVIAAAREEQREVGVSRALGIPYGVRHEFAEALRTAPLTETPLQDRITQLEAELAELADENKRQTARADRLAEQCRTQVDRIQELESEARDVTRLLGRYRMEAMAPQSAREEALRRQIAEMAEAHDEAVGDVEQERDAALAQLKATK